MGVRVWVSRLEAPWGPVWVGSTDRGVCGLSLREGRTGLEKDLKSRRPCEFREDQGANKSAMAQIMEYLAGQRRAFHVSLDPWGTDFQQRVWSALLEIPYGETRSYREVAAILGCPRGARAVGGAVGSNPVPIFIPCHRVVRSNGGLGGFGAGLDIKEHLLALESQKPWGAR